MKFGQEKAMIWSFHFRWCYLKSPKHLKYTFLWFWQPLCVNIHFQGLNQGKTGLTCIGSQWTTECPKGSLKGIRIFTFPRCTSKISKRGRKFDFNCCAKRDLFFHFSQELAQNQLDSKSKLIRNVKWISDPVDSSNFGYLLIFRK